MILTCSNCSTRFYVDGGSFGAAPRKVRCGNCGHAWMQTPVDEDADALGAARAAAVAEAQWETEDDGKRWPVLLGWLVFAVVVAALVAAAYQYREPIVDQWPRASELYALAGVDVAAGRAHGLELRLDDDEVRRGVEDGTPVVLVSGYVRNTGEVDRDIPPLRLMLLDTAGEVVQETVFEIDAEMLAPGGETPFEARIADPDPGATEVRLVFAGE